MRVNVANWACADRAGGAGAVVVGRRDGMVGFSPLCRRSVVPGRGTRRPERRAARGRGGTRPRTRRGHRATVKLALDLPRETEVGSDLNEVAAVQRVGGDLRGFGQRSVELGADLIRGLPEVQLPLKLIELPVARGGHRLLLGVLVV